MNLEETGQVLRKIAVHSKTTPPSPVDIAAWNELPLIQAMKYETALRAVAIYYQQHKTPMAAADLIQTAKAIPEANTARVYGQPGEILCIRCGLVHYATESCSALVPMPNWFRARYGEPSRRAGIPVPDMASDDGEIDY